MITNKSRAFFKLNAASDVKQYTLLRITINLLVSGSRKAPQHIPLANILANSFHSHSENAKGSTC